MRLRTGDITMDLFKRSPNWRNMDYDEFDRFRKCLLLIGDDIVKICEDNNLSYCLAFGSALGSIRHKGFIPWDDDLDIFMPREDYIKFSEIMQKEMGDKYYIRSVSKGDNIAATTCHVRLKGTKYVNYGDFVLTSNEPEEMRGIYIDINPLDDSSDNSFFRLIRGYGCLFALFAQSCVNTRKSIELLKRLQVNISKEEMKTLWFKIFLGKIFSFRTSVDWARIYDKISSGVKNKNSKYVTCYTGYKKISKAVFKRKDIFPTKKGIFEGRSWNIPNNSDAFLRQIYGDYMTLPPKEKHKIHPVFELEFGERINNI